MKNPITPKEVIEEAINYGIRPEDVLFLREENGTLVFSDRRNPSDDGLPDPTGLPIFIYYKDGKAWSKSLQ